MISSCHHTGNYSTSFRETRHDDDMLLLLLLLHLLLLLLLLRLLQVMVLLPIEADQLAVDCSLR